MASLSCCGSWLEKLCGRARRGERPNHETRTSQDVQARAQCSTPEGLEAAVPEQDGKCRRGFADPRKGSRDSLSFSFHWVLCK